MRPLTTPRLSDSQRAYTASLTDPYTLHPAAQRGAVYVYRYLGERVWRELLDGHGVVVECDRFPASRADRLIATGSLQAAGEYEVHQPEPAAPTRLPQPWDVAEGRSRTRPRPVPRSSASPAVERAA